MTWDLSCPDWRERLRTGRSLVPELPIDCAEGDRAVRIFDKLRLADVPGTPTMAEAGGDWFRDIVRALFGSMDPATRQRAIRELFLLVPKKNSKTSNGALLMLTALLMNERPRATLIMTAPVQDTATLAFDAAAGAIGLDPVLSKVLHVREHLKTIMHRETKAELQIMTFDPAVLTGQKPVAVLIDEVHVVAKMSKAPSAMRQIRGGMLPFPEAFLAFITTQSEDAPTGVFRDELIRAREVRDGKREGVALLPVLYEFPPEVQEDGDAWRDPAIWWTVNPNNGRSISVPRLVQEFAEAESKGEHELRAWASQHLNVEIGLALHANRWIGADFWASQGRSLTLEALLDSCDVVEIGIDGGGLDDMLGLCVLGRETKTGHWLAWHRAWIHPIALERRKTEAQRYRDFADEGDLVIVESVGEDVEQLIAIVLQVDARGTLDKIGCDRAGLDEILDALTDSGISSERIVGVSQSWPLMAAINTCARKLAAGELWHAGSRLMAWCIGNARAEVKGNALYIHKETSGTAKIDPLMATFDAAYLLARAPKTASPEQYLAFIDDYVARTRQEAAAA